ncbi:MAG: hydroxyacylglutathione hydrolase [Myxococcales bacterium]|nr:hydroxyacylglutathione hydrolase [Myxococcales bacterium]
MKHPRKPFLSATGALEVHQIPAWQDNLIWLGVNPKTREAFAVDGPDAAGVLDYCEAQGLKLTTIVNTHTHGDHIGINRDLAERNKLGQLRVVGGASTASAIPGLTDPVSDGDELTVIGVRATAMLTEGHINGHISYLFDNVLFCGDTLFGAGCGYLFDGPASKMHASLARLRDLPDDTRVCCAHEYTEDNLRFAWSVDARNTELAQRIREVFALRARGECSLPSTIGIERATNPFMRFDAAGIKASVAAAMPDADLSSDASVFAATRALKDRKDYRQQGDDALPLETR